MRFIGYLKALLSRVVSPFYYRQERLAISRRPYSMAEFTDYFSSRGMDADGASAVWEALRECADFKDLTPYPQDNILKVYGLADQDLDDCILDSLSRCGRRIPPSAETIILPPVETVADLVKVVAQMK